MGTTPNFFIVGAPKCGTWSLVRYLRDHPEVFVSDPKEPWYFSTDINPRWVTSETEYQGLFSTAGPEKRAVGEGSTIYLFSQVAVPNVIRAYPDARIIVMLRNPVEAMASWHAQLVYNGWERLKDFQMAWSAQTARAAGNTAEPWCPDGKFLQYGEVGKFGGQVERLLLHVKRERVLLLFLDDLKRAPRESFRQVTDFLGVSPWAPPEFKVFNIRKEIRFEGLRWLMQCATEGKKRLGFRFRTGLFNPLVRLNTKTMPKKSLAPGLASELRRHFADDISRLATISGRSLSHWQA